MSITTYIKRCLQCCFFLIAFQAGYSQQHTIKKNKRFVYVDGQNLVKPGGEQLHIKGINLGNWLNPEGYMLLFKKSADCYRLIDEAFKEMTGEAFTEEFWRKYQTNYITKDDIHYIRKTGMNTIRLPFHYKMLTDEPYMGYSSKKHGYEILDRVISWCRDEGLYIILDMHVAPGGQTGVNIDDSYGYPWLLATEKHKEQFCKIWKEIAKRYADNTTVLGYDLLNEPIASSYFKEDTAMLNVQLESLFRRGTRAIREVDKNHPIILSGSLWGQDYSIFKDWKYDDNLMFTCHIYHCDTTEAGIKNFLDYRAKFNLPFYMGETGQEPDQWIAGFRRLLDRNNIGWTFWPYKKMGNKVSPADSIPKSAWGTYSLWKTTSMVTIDSPKDWNKIVAYTSSDRSSFESIRKNRPDQKTVRVAMDEFINSILFANCPKNEGYIKALGLNY